MAFSRLIEKIEEGSGKFDLQKQYFINNSTDEDIIVKWGVMEPEARGSGIYKIKAGEKGGPYPQFLAYHIVKALVSREMQKDGKSRFFGSAEMRAPYEDKYLLEIEAEDPDIEQLEAQERAILATQPIAEEGYTSSETRRKYIKKAKPLDEVEEFKGANR